MGGKPMKGSKEKEITFKDISYEKSFAELSKEAEKVAERVKHIVRVNSSGGFPSSPTKKGVLKRLLG
jgi:hypothetical protein